MHGYLEIIIGSMWAGKTSRLINLYHEYRKKMSEKEIMIINYIADTRYNNINHNGLCNHNKECISCIKANTF